ncbi:MAG: hypothetical protein K0R75_1897 [Paenibacillaceae bacterium]|nr:hypothetical protein [Paenibacillaceae bacterium]
MQKKASRKSFRFRLEEMVTSLRNDIISGKLAVDSFLPSESDLEKMFQLGNSSVRKGLETLVQEGLIEKIPRVGNMVKKPPQEQAPMIRFGYQDELGRHVRMNALLEQFHQKYPHIRVKPLELYSSSYSNVIRGQLESDALDVVLLNSNNFLDFADQGCMDLLEPLQVTEDFPAFLTDPFTENGRTLMQPFVYSPVILCYNRDHYREKNIPEPDSSWTWEDLIRYAHRLAVPYERFGFFFYLVSRNRWPVFLLQSGQTFQADRDGRYRLKGSELMAGLNFCRDMISQKDVFPLVLAQNDVDAESLFLEGKVSMIMTTYYFLNELREAPFEFDVAPLPALKENKTLMIVAGLAVNSRSQNKAAVKLLVDFLASYETQLRIKENTLNIPAHRIVSGMPVKDRMYRPSRFNMFREIIPTFRLLNELGLSHIQMRSIQRAKQHY